MHAPDEMHTRTCIYYVRDQLKILDRVKALGCIKRAGQFRSGSDRFKMGTTVLQLVKIIAPTVLQLSMF